MSEFAARLVHTQLAARENVETELIDICSLPIGKHGRHPVALSYSDCFCGDFCRWVLSMRFDHFSFGSVRIDGVLYEHDVVIDRGQIRKRKKKPSRKFREAFGHTPLSLEEDIPWKCRRLVVGTGTGALPIMREVKAEAKRRKVELLAVPTPEAIRLLQEDFEETNAILHLTC